MVSKEDAVNDIVKTYPNITFTKYTVNDNGNNYIIILYGKPDSDGVYMGNTVTFVVNKNTGYRKMLSTLDYALNKDKYIEPLKEE